MSPNCDAWRTRAREQACSGAGLRGLCAAAADLVVLVLVLTLRRRGRRGLLPLELAPLGLVLLVDLAHLLQVEAAGAQVEVAVLLPLVGLVRGVLLVDALL